MRFKKLFYEIVTEHAGLQVCIYFLSAIVIPVICSAFTNHSFSDLVVYTVPLSIALKLLSVISSAVKAAIIIRKCEAGDSYFLEIYREWTGKYY